MAAILLPIMVRADDKSMQNGTELIRHWEAQPGLFGNAPIRLKATFELSEMRSGKATGTLEAIFVGPEQWRVALDFPGYQEVLVRNGGDKVWRKRSYAAEPIRVTQLKEILRLPKVLQVAQASANIDRVRERKYQGQKLTCVRRSTGSKDNRTKGQEELCFDAEGRLKLRDRELPHEQYEYSDYREINGLQVPTSFRAVVEGKEVVRAVITDLGTYPGSAPSPFATDASYEVRTWCEQAIPPKPEYTPDPAYPDMARRGGLQATVTVMGEVRTDGSLHDLVVLQTADQSLNDATLRTLAQWRFRPATCKGAPIPFELKVEMNFRLGY